MTRNFTLTSKVAILLRTAVCQAKGCDNPLCEGVEWDHINAVALGGTNATENGQALCPECHSLKTNGPKHYSKGSDKNKAAAEKRHKLGPKPSSHQWAKRKIPKRRNPWWPRGGRKDPLPEMGDPNVNE